MNWSDFAGKKVGLLGAGIENLALIPLLQKAGAKLTVCNEAPTSATDQAERQGLTVVTGKNYLADLGRFDYVFRVAGMPIERLEKAMSTVEKRPIVTSPVDLFLSLSPCHIVGVTGTKGKGTTATMIGAILSAAGLPCSVVGNIGKPIFSIYDDLTTDTYAIAELSSFQLEDVKHSPEIAVVLPITEEHLQPLSKLNPNFHSTLEAYVQAKANITAFQTETNLLVYAADSPTASNIADASSARRIGVGQRRGDVTFTAEGELMSGGHEMVSFAEIGLRGVHVWLDAAMAVTVCRELGVGVDRIIEGLRNFKPLPHRLQKVGEINGVTFIDDSYATAPDATIAAIGAYDRPLVWIGGGSRKGVSFKDLGLAIKRSTVKAVILMGQEGPRIKRVLDEVGFNGTVKFADSMPQAVSTAKQMAKAGDIVLLSPACASLDMFKNASDRGEQFDCEVNEQL